MQMGFKNRPLAKFLKETRTLLVRAGKLLITEGVRFRKKKKNAAKFLTMKFSSCSFCYFLYKFFSQTYYNAVSCKLLSAGAGRVYGAGSQMGHSRSAKRTRYFIAFP
jgi:hypothetical protein